MNMVPVVSVTVAFVGYDHVTHTLRVTFRSGGIYAYYDVPVFLYEAMLLPHPGAASDARSAPTATGASQPDSKAAALAASFWAE
jgi:hypothetical protein